MYREMEKQPKYITQAAKGEEDTFGRKPFFSPNEKTYFSLTYNN